MRVRERSSKLDQWNNYRRIRNIQRHGTYLSGCTFSCTECVNLIDKFKRRKLEPKHGSAFGKLRLTETSMIYNGGVNGLSNALVMGAWFLQASIGTASNGWKSIHPHMGLSHVPNGVSWAYYNPFHANGDGTYSPNPIFYAMYMFSLLNGEQVVSS